MSVRYRGKIMTYQSPTNQRPHSLRPRGATHQAAVQSVSAFRLCGRGRIMDVPNQRQRRHVPTIVRHPVSDVTTLAHKPVVGLLSPNNTWLRRYPGHGAVVTAFETRLLRAHSPLFSAGLCPDVYSHSLMSHSATRRISVPSAA